MLSPHSKRRPWHVQSIWQRKPYEKKEPTHPFYTRPAWRNTRAAYIQNYIQTIQTEVPQGYITIKTGRYELEPHQITRILSINKPCEKCLQMYCIDDTREINEGTQLDHIDPVNPDNPLDTAGKWGDPMNWDNLQLLCARHHSRKTSMRDQKIIKLRK
jgi:5-methylcytosine-specific restriction endonuclease McrA